MECAMAEYRAYLIGSDGHFCDAVHLVCTDDTEAIEKTKRLVNGHDVELWQQDRMVTTLKAIPNQTSKKM
jgi:hypothetical protein